MTPEELAVVQAAMRWHDAVLAHPESLHPLANLFNPLLPALNELSRTTYLLAVTCPECNAGGHTCPGDGNPIPHGATDCGEHAPMQDCPDRGSRLDPCPIGCTDTVCIVNQKPAEADLEPKPVMIWVPRTWEDVRTGDHVRAPGSDATAYVKSAVHLRWHIKPGTGRYNPEPLEWSGVRVTMSSKASASEPFGSYEMDPGKPVEIEVSEAEAHVLNGLGWETRVGLIAGRAS
jgi:hypothetical protein